KLVYPDNSAITYLYNGVGRTSQVKDASATYASFAYSADDLTNNATFGNGVVESYAYNGRGWPTSIKATYGQTTYLNLGYGYDYSGNVVMMGSATFSYDRLDRLLTASGGFGSQSYTYDAIGNRLQLDQNATTVVLRPNGAGSTTQWTPVGCTPNWQCVDEATSDGETTRVESSTIGNVDMYAIQDIAPNGGTVVSVTISAVARADNTGCIHDPTCGGGEIKLRANGGTATSFGYDANGNTFSRFGGTKACYEWNPKNLLTKVKSVSTACTDTGTQIQAYTYDGLDRRLKVDGASSSTWTVSIFSG